MKFIDFLNESKDDIIELLSKESDKLEIFMLKDLYVKNGNENEGCFIFKKDNTHQDDYYYASYKYTNGKIKIDQNDETFKNITDIESKFEKMKLEKMQ